MGKPIKDRQPITDCPEYFIDSAGLIWHQYRGSWQQIKSKPHTRGHKQYRRVRLRVKGANVQRYLAVLVLEAFIGPRPGPGYAVFYKDGDSNNCNLENLEWSLNSSNAVVSLKDFVSAWQTSRTMREVCEKTGLLPSACTARVIGLRAKGVSLKKLGRETVDYTEIAKFAAEFKEGTNADH